MKDLIGREFMSDFFGDVFRGFDRKSMPMKTDISEDEKTIVLDIEMPGFEKENIDIKINDGYMIVSAKKEFKEENKNENGKTYVSRERIQSASRSYFVGDKIVEEGIKAKYQNGILCVTIPKEEPKKIPDHKIMID